MASTESKKVSLEQISSLREITGAGVLLCKEALAATDGNQDEAVKYLRHPINTYEQTCKIFDTSCPTINKHYEYRRRTKTHELF